MISLSLCRFSLGSPVQNLQIKLIGDSKVRVCVNVNINDCLSLCVSCAID